MPDPLRRVLIVDDEMAVARLLQIALRRAGYHVESASNPQEAMALLQTGSFDAVLSDVVMTHGNGRVLVERISKVYPEIRCALMSGSDSGEGPYPFLQKPFDPHEAVDLISRMLKADRGISS